MQYKIKKGDTLSAIAKKLNISMKDLAEANDIKDVDKIYAGANLIIPTPKKKKASTVERVIPEEKKEVIKPKKKKKQKKIVEKKREPILPINVRQFFNPQQDRTEKDLSKAEQDALERVIAYSQKPEVRQAKIERGINPDTIRYSDYNALGAENLEQEGSTGSLIGKVTDPVTVLKSFLGRASLSPTDDGGFIVKDKFDFTPKTQETGLAKLSEYLGSVRDIGVSDAYGQLRNFMGYYGPQEGTGEGGRSNINLSAIGGQTRYNFNKGGTMNIQQQTNNVASQGRFGDSMLMHVNPAEVRGLAQVMPLTVNPQTGQPEAFLPFLAPMLGSWLGSSLLAGKTIAGMALSKAAAAGIGAGLAQTAVTGDIKEGLKAGLTSGMFSRILGGGAEAQKLAEGTQAATTEATNIATADLLQNPSNLGITDPNLLNIASTDPTLAAQLGPEALTDTARIQLANRVANSSNFIKDEAAQYLADYAGDIPGPGAATFGDDFSTVFSDGVGQGLSNIGSAAMNDPLARGTLLTTGMMYGMDATQADYEEQMRRMEEERLERKRQNELMNPEPILYSAEGGRTGYFQGGRFGDLPDNIGGELPQIYAPARQPYQVNPDFMAGFSPETMYFRPETLSAPASGLQAGAPPVNEAVPYAGSQGGYGGRQAYIAPQVSIDPYAAYTGEAPEGLKFGKPLRPVFEKPELPDQGLVNPGLPDFGTGPIGLGGRIGIPNIGDLDIQSIIDGLDQYNIPERDIGLGEFMNQQITQPNTLGEPLPIGVNNQIDISQYLGNREDTLAGAQAMFGPQVEYADANNTGQEPSMDSGLGEMMSAEASMASGITPPPRGLSIFGKRAITPQPSRGLGIEAFLDSLPLEAIPEEQILEPIEPILPFRGRGISGRGMAEGGTTDMMSDPLTQEVARFILGESDNEEALNMFLTKYGNEAFMELREAVLQSIVPGAQTEGLIAGDSEGGMDDDLRGMIGNKERIAVSQDEFIVPADVVSMLGDGSSNAGSQELYDMMDRVRQTKTGTTKQAPRLANAGGLLPA